jgi:hypothetical protein
MGPSPYREAAARSDERDAPGPFPNREIVLTFAILWVSSALRVAAALARQETIGQEPILAAGIVLILPLLGRKVLGGHINSLRRFRSRSRRDARDGAPLSQ